MTARLPVAEIFGPTYQGEGPSSGQRAVFVRFGGCNLTCSGCDTPYTWDGKRFDLRAELTPMTANEILDRIPDVPLAVITGGEPLLHQASAVFGDLLAGLRQRGVRVEVETNGTIAPTDTAPGVRYNVSPKLDGPMSGDAVNRRIVRPALDAFATLAKYGTAVFKFVCRAPADLIQVRALVQRHQIPRWAVQIMPEGTDPDTVLRHGRALADHALAEGYHLTTRLHVLLWPDTARGR